MDARARSTGPSSSSFCPACGKPIDALRAGQVAILDGAFRYFCDAGCKSVFVDISSKRPLLDALTADPPPVASAARSKEPPVVISGVREPPAPPEPYFPAPPVADAQDSAVVHRDDDEPLEGEYENLVAARDVPPVVEAPVDPPAAAVREPDDAHDASPLTLRSPLVTEDGKDDVATPKAIPLGARLVRLSRTVSRHIVVVSPVLGVFAGVLAAVVSLAGDAAGILRLPLALLAAVIVFVRKGVVAREPSEPASWVIVVPIAGASLVSIASAFVHDVHADAHASFVGLAAASALTVEILLSRARRDVVLSRARTASLLAVGARVVRGDVTTDVDASQVKPGEQVLVEAGETIAVDGVVAAGEAEVAPWLESPALLGKVEGDAVVAGAVVVSGRLRVNTTFSDGERAWLRLAGPAASTRIDVAAPLVAFVRRMVERGALATALVVAGAVYASNGSGFDVAIAACGGAHALAAVAAVAAAALAHARAHTTAQRRGIVYKDAVAFDAAARADVAVLCSRGTILLGEPEIVVVEAITKDGISGKGWLATPPESQASPVPPVAEENASDVARVLSIAAGAEMSSTHPFAAAILREARARAVRPDNVRSALGHSGLGVTALAANGDRVIVGSRAFLLQEKVSVAIADARASELEAEGRSVLLVAIGGRLAGLLALQDGLRPGARAAIQRLHDARIEPVLLSGEARDTCETIARALDIEHVRPEILPVDRGTEVRALSDGGRIVAALGHASTDDGALGAADVSVAMEAAGAAPGEWAVALASDDVRDAALALTVPRACRDRARTAVVIGGVTQALGVLGIAFGVIPPAIVPVLGVLGAAMAVTIVREPTILADGLRK